MTNEITTYMTNNTTATDAYSGEETDLESFRLNHVYKYMSDTLLANYNVDFEYVRNGFSSEQIDANIAADSLAEALYSKIPAKDRENVLEQIRKNACDSERIIVGAINKTAPVIKKEISNLKILSPEETVNAIVTLKKDTREVYQVGRGPGKFLVLHSHKVTENKVNLENAKIYFKALLLLRAKESNIIDNKLEKFTNTKEGEMAIPPIEAKPLPPRVAALLEVMNQSTVAYANNELNLVENPYIAKAIAGEMPTKKLKWDDMVNNVTITANPQPAVVPWTIVPKPRATVIKNKPTPVAISLPPDLASYPELEAIYKEFETTCATLMAKLKDQLAILVEENTILNQATWHS